MPASAAARAFSRRSRCSAAAALADRYDEQLPEKPQRYVTDRAGVFGPGQAEALNAKLEQFERTPPTRSSSGSTGRSPRASRSRTSRCAPPRSGARASKKTDNGAGPLRLHRGPEDAHRGRLRPRRRDPGRDGQADHRGRDRSAVSRRGLSRAASTRARTRSWPPSKGEYKGTGPDRGPRAAGGQRRSVRHVPGHGHLLRDLLRPAGALPAQPRFRTPRRRRLVDAAAGWRGGFSGGGFGGGGGGFSGAAEAASPAAAGSFGGGGASGSW